MRRRSAMPNRWILLAPRRRSSPKRSRSRIRSTVRSATSYARFRENPGFQQTRGLIRLMRVVTSRLFDEKHGKADKIYLIHAHDLDLNDRETLAEVTQINPTLDNAISHDIASNGQAIAELMDANLGSVDAQDVCKLLLVASLANI